MKKLITVFPENLDKIIALMAAIQFEEVGRYITGGQSSAIEVVITFEGLSANYHENNYIEEQCIHTSNYRHYYSLRLPNGYYTNDFSIFKMEHDKKSHQWKIKSFNP